MADGISVLGVTMDQMLQPEFRSSLVGLEASKSLSVALFALLLFEYAITVDDEMLHFWTGSCSISHCLFFFNRYFPPLIVLFDLICFFLINPSLELCQTSIPLLFLLTVFAMSIIKAILVTRVWYQFPGLTFIRLFMAVAFLATTSVSLAFLFVSVNRLEIISVQGAEIFGIDIVGCRATRPGGFWKIYLPDLLMHTLLYGLTVYDTITNPEYRENTSARKKLLRDGGAFYVIVLISVGLTSLGSFLTNFPVVNIPATFSPGLLVATSIATSRMMFSLRRATLEVDSSVNAQTFEFVPMPLANGSIISDMLPLKKVPSSRFSTDSDVFPSPAAVRSENRFVLGLGSIDEEKGMADRVSGRKRSFEGNKMESFRDLVKQWVYL